MALSTAQGFIGAGDLYAALIDEAGNLGAYIDFGNVTKLGIQPASEIKEQKSKKRDSYGQVLETVALQDTAQLAATLETVNRIGLRYAFMGEDQAYSQTSGTVSGTPGETTIARLGGWVPLAHEAVSSFVLKDSTGATTYVLGTDYELNARLGWYRAIPGGAITEAQSLRAAYSYGAFTGAAIRGNVKPQIRARLLLDGKNLVDDSIGILDIWEVVLSTSSEFDWFSEDWNTVELQGRLKTPAGKTEPFVYRTR